jgi:hypothetical protein
MINVDLFCLRPRTGLPRAGQYAKNKAAGAADKMITMPSDDADAALRPGSGAETTRQPCVFCHPYVE